MKNRFFKFKLSTSLFLILFVGIVPPLAFHCIYSFQNTKTEILKEENEIQKQTLNLFTSSSAYPLYTLSKENIESFLFYFLRSKNIAGLRIRQADGSIFIESGSLDSSKYKVLSSEIFYRSELIGFSDVAFIPVNINKVIFDKTKELTLFLTILVLTSSLMMYFLLKYKFLNPIYRLKMEALELEPSYQNNHLVHWTSDDEIGEVGNALYKSKEKIFTLLADLEFKNKQLNTLNLELEKRVQQKTSELIQSAKMVSLGEMAAGIAHEINNPLTIIIGKTQILNILLNNSNPTLSRQKINETLIVINKTALRINKIVKGLLAFSRNSEGDPMEWVNLSFLIDEVRMICEERFIKSNVLIKFSEIPPVRIYCRSTQIEQVLVNLLNNSYDAIENLNEKWVKIDFHVLESSTIDIRITDSGKVDDPVVIEKMMDPFFTTKSIGKGTGLGLSISAGIIDSHGGELIFDKFSLHTSFVMSLPCQRLKESLTFLES